LPQLAAAFTNFQNAAFLSGCAWLNTLIEGSVGVLHGVAGKALNQTQDRFSKSNPTTTEEHKMHNRAHSGLASARHLGGVLLLALLGLPTLASATATPDRSGKEVVESVCVACHGPGVNGAPHIGMATEWAPRAAHGIGAMTRNAITGIRNMPAHGGHGELSDLEISRAVAFMVSGGVALDPSKPYSSPQQISGEILVKAHCYTCHESGKDGAPRIGSLRDWQPRLQQGMSLLVQSAIRGHNAMPPRSGINHLSDNDMRAAVTYMVTQMSVTAQRD
jgi:cytochrome c5